jgi:gliding motility-associated-like protein/uncharacterized repeat protein (TIGR01451 family)
VFYNQRINAVFTASYKENFLLKNNFLGRFCAHLMSFFICSDYPIIFKWKMNKIIQRFLFSFQKETWFKLMTLFLFLLVSNSSATAQTYKTHYIAPAPWQYWSSANEIVISTNTAGTTATIKKSDGSLVTTLTPTPGNPVVYRFAGDPVGLAKNSLNTILNAAGIIVTGNNPIAVNIRNVASDDIPAGSYVFANDQYIKGNASLFSFGDAAVGNAFRVGYYRDGDLNGVDANISTKRPVYSILALENNTTIKLNSTAITTLNSGQSYILQAAMGSLVETSGPAVMNTGINVDAPEGCGDGAYNPVPPISSLGNEYVVIRGKGNNTAEQTTIVATEANTSVTVANFDHSGVLQSTNTYNLIAEGSFITFPNGVSTGTNTGNVQVGDASSGSRIVATKNVVAYSGTANRCEVDLATLAPLSACGGSLKAETYKFRENNLSDLPYFAYLITKSSTDKIYLTTNGGSPAFNNTDVETIPGVGVRRQLGSSGAYAIDFENTNIGSPNSFYLSSNTRWTVAMVQSGGGFSMSNFLSPFPEKALKPTYAQADCASALLSADANSNAPFQWYLNGVAIAGATARTYQATLSGSYTITSTLDCGISSQSLPVTIALCNVDLILTKAVDNTSPAKGGTVNFTITVKNSNTSAGTVTGTGNAIGVSATDLLPSGYTYVSNVVATGTSYDAATGLWSIGSMNAGQSLTLTITAKVNNSGNYNNTATVTGPQADPVLSNNTASASVTPVNISLTSASGTDNQSICAGGTTTAIQYQITGTPVVLVTGLGASGLNYGTTTSGGNTILTIDAGTVSNTGNYNYTVRATYALPSATIINTTGSIIVSPQVATPVFSLGTTSSRCQGFGTQTYSATANNATGITYSISPAGSGVINANTGTVTWSSVYNGTATITASAVGICGIKTANHTVTINSTGTVSGAGTVCSGSNGTLTLSGAPSTVVRWESSTDNGINWTAIANTTTTLNYVNIEVTTLYRAIVSGGGCTNAASGTANVTVTPRPVISNQTYYICKTGSFIFAPIDVPNGTTYTWSSPILSSANIAGGTAGTGQLSIDQTLTNSGTTLQTATYTVTPTYSSCAGNAFTITVYVVPTLTASATGTSICSASAFSVTPNSNVNGTTYTWTAALTNGTATGFSNQSTAVTVPISQTLTNTSGADATVRYTVTPIYNGCSGATFTFDVIVRTATPAPTVSNQTFCEISNATVASLAATGTSVKWYTQATGGTALASTTALANGTYYASQTLNSCESATRASIRVTITATPAPTASNQTFCEISNATVANLAATGTSVKWYTSPTGGTALASTTALVNGTYYASQTLNSCESATQAQITVTITATPAPTAGNQTFCEISNATVTNLAATGTSVKWYTSPTGGTALASTRALANGTYYASQTLNSCESATRASITVTITATPAPTASNQTFCEISNATVASLAATGTSVKWYTSPTGGTTLASTIALTNGTYYASQTLNSCESATRASIAVTIYLTPKGFNDTKALDCAGSFSYDIQTLNINNTTNGGNLVPASFTWTVNSNANITGAANGSGNTITQTLINTSNSIQTIVYTVTPKATVTGGCAGNTFTVTVSVPVCSSISITKSANVTSVNKAGNVIAYTIVVANTGNTSQNNVVVNDPLLGGNLSNPIKTGNSDNILEKGETWTYNGSYTILQSDLNNNGNPANNAGKITNTASVNTTELPMAKTAIADVNIALSPAVTLVKTGTLNLNGNSISYLFTVKNTGNVTLNNLVVTDSKVTGTITLAATTLAPGMSTTASASYTISAAEKATGSVSNTAMVNGKDPLNGNVSDISGTTESNSTPTVTNTGVYADDDEGTLSAVTGGVAVNNVLVNDKLNGNQATLVNVTISQISSSNPNISIDPATGKVNVLPGTPVGTYTLVYQIEDKANPGNVKVATVTIHLVTGVILAVDDNGSANSVTGGMAVTNVLANDTYNGTTTAPTLADVTITNGTNDSNGKVILDPTTGAVSVAANTPAGIYTLTYTITAKLDVSKTSTATVKVTVASGALLAKDDAGTSNSVTGGTAVANVLANDTYNGTTTAPTLADVTINNGTNDSNGKVTLDPATGAVSIAANTPAGIYTLTYTITDKLDASKTSTATVKVTVASGALLAKDDAGTSNSVTGGTAVANVLANDTYNGTTTAPTLADVTITNGTNDSNGKVTLDPATGAVSVAANTPAGIYTLTYTITDKLDASKTSTATVKVTVASGALLAKDDEGTSNSVTGGTAVANVLANDTYNGTTTAPTLADVTITNGTNDSNVKVTLDPTTGAVSVAANTPAGIYTLTYTITDKLDVSKTSTATVKVTVASGALLAKDDAGTSNSVTGGTAVANVLANDTYNGTTTAPTLADVTITNGTNDSNGKVTLDPTTGAVSVAANTPAGIYTLTYTITDKLDASQTSTSTVKVTVTSGALLAKDDAGTANSVTGGTAVTSVLANDSYNGTTTAPTLADVTITNGTNDSNGKVTLDPATGTVSVAANTPAGIYTLTYTITDKLDASKTSTATVKVTVASGALLAKDDAGTANSVTGGTAVTNVLANDSYNGTTTAPTLADVTITNGTNDSNGKVTLDPTTGAVSVAANTLAGVYTLTYTITDKLDVSKTSTATVKVTVASGALLAKDDAGTSNSVTGGTVVANVLANDSYNGTTTAPTLADVTITNGTNDSNGKVTLDPATGAVSIAANTPAGIYTLTYTITDKLDASKTSTATVKVTVASGALLAKDDAGSASSVTGGTAVANVLANDTYNGTTTAPALADVTINNGTNDSNGKVTLDPTTGAVSVAANTPAGIYTLTYTIADKLDASKTSTATVKVTVASGALLAKDDAGSANGLVGGVAVNNVLSNDSYNGTSTAPTLNDVNLSQISTTNPNVTLNIATGQVDVKPNTPAGVYTLVYEIVDKLDASQIKQATVTITVAAPALAATNDSGNANGYTGGTAVENVLVNDTYNGNPATLNDVKLSQVSTSNSNVTLDVTTGKVNVAPNTSAGTYTLVYQIEDKLNTGQTKIATVIITVGTNTILAKDDTGTANGFTGGIAVENILINDKYNDVSTAAITTVVINQISTSNPKINIDAATGKVNVASGTLPGVYTLTYQIADKLDAAKISTAVVTVNIPNWITDLQISKTANVTGVETNGDISYTITIKNNGPATVLSGESIGLIENLPAGLENISYSAIGGTYSTAGKTFILTADLLVGQQVSLMVNGHVAAAFAGADLVNSVSINPTAKSTDPENTNNQSTVTTTILKGKIALVKTGALSADRKSITYTFNITNTGNVVLNNVVLIDQKLALNKTFSTALAVGASFTFDQVYTLSQSDKDAGSVSNTASVSAKTPAGNTVNDISGTGSGNDNPTETPILNTSSLTFTKVASAVGTKIGESIDYTFTIANTGSVTLSNLTVSDAAVDAGSIKPESISTLAPGASVNVTAKHTLTQNDINLGSFTNQASIKLTDNKGNVINQLSDDPTTLTPNDATVTKLTPSPGFTLTKSATNSATKAGDVINYSIIFKNTGNVTLTDIALVDANADAGSLTPSNIISVLPGATVNITAKHTVKQSDVNAGGFSNQVSANVKDPKGNTIMEVSDDPSTPAADDATFSPIAANPSLRFTKMFANAAGVVKVIEYSIQVTNTGNITLTDIVVTDEGADPGSITPATISKLEPAETALILARHTLTQPEIDNGKFVNQAGLVAKYSGANKLSKLSDDPRTLAPDDPTIFPIKETPGLTLVKTGVLSADGNSVTYTFTVKNTGNVTLSNFSLLDPKISSTLTFTPASIAPDQTAVATAVYAITQAEKNASSVRNTATLTAITPAGTPVSDVSGTEEDNDYPTILELPKIVSSKTVADANNNGKAEANEVLTYNIIVKNNGNAARTGVKITDAIPANTTYLSASADNGGSLIGNMLNWNNLTIPANGQVQVSFKVTVNAIIPSGVLSVNNIATVTDPGNTLTPLNPAVAIPTEGMLEGSKSVVDNKGNKDGKAQANEVLTYSLQVKNTGGSALNGVTITDELPAGLTYIPNSVSGYGTVMGNTLKWTINMQANSSTVLTFDAKVAPDVNSYNTIKNVVVMTSPTGTTIKPEALMAVDKSADLMVTKELLTKGDIKTGSDVTYKITVTNKGSNRATGVTVTDKLSTIIDAPKEITVTIGTTTYTTTSRDFVWLVGSLDLNQSATLTFKSRTLAAGVLNNSATVKADQPDPILNNNMVMADAAIITGDDLLIPNLFTPNGDGINDTFEINGLAEFTENEITIVNRWGNEVFRVKGYQNNWTGEGLNEGTYYYLLRARKGGNNEWKVFKGYITLIRAFKN